MNTTTNTTADVAAQLEQHREQAAQLQHQLEQRQAAEQAEREQRLHAYDRQTVAAYADEEAAIKAEEDAAREAFIEAVQVDPVLSAWTKYRAARWRRTHLRSHVGNAARSVGGDVPPDLAYRDPRLLEDMLQLCEDTARDVAELELLERTNQRTDAGNGQAAS